MENIILQTHGISVKYGNFPALDDVSIRLKNKHIYGFIGENGAGKTTLMKVLTGLLYPTSGTFSLFGKSAPSDILKMRRNIGSTMEAPALYPEYSAYRNLELQRILIGNPDREICGKLLGMLGLTEVKDKKVRKFSMGMKQRLSIAMALVGKPRLLILDEPINGLDPKNISELRSLLKIEGYKAKRFILMYLAAAVLAAAGFFLGLLKLPENMDTAKVFSLSICDTSFMFLISLVAAWFAGNDFQNRTIHNEIKVGYSRFSVFMARTITTVIMAVLLHLVYVFATVLGFSVTYRFDSSIFSMTDFVWMLVVMLQICANICIVMFIVFALKKVTSGIAVTVVFSFVSCNILRNFISKSVFRLTCFSLAQTSDNRTLALSAVFAAAVVVISLTATHFVFRKAEIK